MNKLKVEVWSDIVCPFCYIGEKHYEQALAEFPYSDEIELEFKSFQLDPNFNQNPDEKYDLTKGLAEKYNRSLAEIEQMQTHIVATAKAAGLDFDFENSYRFNTQLAHQVMHKAYEKGLGKKMADALFAAYFEQGKNLAKTEILKQVALENGLSEEEFTQATTDEAYAYQVKQDMQEGASLGVSSVPFFVFDRKYGVSGAQPKEAFLQTLEKSYQDWKAKNPIQMQNTSSGESCDINGNCETLQININHKRVNTFQDKTVRIKATKLEAVQTFRTASWI